MIRDVAIQVLHAWAYKVVMHARLWILLHTSLVDEYMSLGSSVSEIIPLVEISDPPIKLVSTFVITLRDVPVLTVYCLNGSHGYFKLRLRYDRDRIE